MQDMLTGGGADRAFAALTAPPTLSELKLPNYITVPQKESLTLSIVT